MKLNVEPLRGFRDLIAQEALYLQKVIEKSEELARRWGFERVFLPTVERFELFSLKSGEEIKRTMFVFKDKAKRDVALRPEATASVVRAYLHKMRGFPKPLKVFSIVNVFRYDEPQYARYREFYQADFEVLGSSSPLADAELISMLWSFYEDLGLPFQIVVGTVSLLRKVLEKEGILGEDQDHAMHLIDKGLLDKLKEFLKRKAENPRRATEVIGQLVELEGGPEVIKEGVEIVREYGISEIGELEELVRYLPEDVLKRCLFKVGFARGLAYYTGLIYEVKVKDFPVSVAGGGRYDALSEVYGGERLPATGFAIGLDRTALALAKYGMEPKSKNEVIVIPLAPEVGKVALEVQRRLAGLGFSSTLLDDFKSLKKALAYASEKGFHWAVIIGKRDYEEGKLTVKNLLTRTQLACRLEDLLDCFLRTSERSSTSS